MKLLRKFYPVEILCFIYILLTAVYIAVFSGKIDNGLQLLCNRILIGASVIGVAALSAKMSGNKLLAFVRYVYPACFIVYWYPETYYLNECIFDNLDHVFVQADQFLFGCQPSIVFSAVMPWRWFSELMSFGYLSYYLILIFIGVYFYFCKDRLIAQKSVFIMLCSFFIYYIIFIILPVVGPQFYFPEPDSEVPAGYIFRDLLIAIQDAGEKPTGAFPSSHVSICFVSMILIYKYAREYFVYFIPVALLLVASTVYIKAHYLIDVIGGFVTAPFAYWLSVKCWERIRKISKN